MRLADLIGDEVLGLRLVGDPPADRLERSVTGCSQSELMDPSPYIARGELVLTLGMGMNVRDVRTWDAYVERIVGAGASALGFGLGPVHAAIPEGLALACSHYDLPLIELAPDFPLIKLSRHIWQELAAERYEIARRGWELADDCIHEATEGAPLTQLLRRLSETVGGRVQLLDPAGFEIGAAGESHREPGRTTRARLRLPGGEHQHFQLAVEARDETMLLQPLLGPALAVVAMQLSYTLTARSPMHSQSAGMFFQALLDPRSDAEHQRTAAVSTGFVPDAPWDAVTVRRPETVSLATLRLLTWRLRVLLEREYARVRFYDEADRATLLMQGRRTDRHLGDILAEVADAEAGLDVRYNRSLSFDEIAVALQVCRRAPLRAGVAPAPVADLLSLVEGLPRSGVSTLARRALGPLADAEPVLLETLEVYLETSGSTRAVCDRLFIHRNTLSYRMRRIETLLGVDLEDGQTRAVLLLAFRLRNAG
ncbi:PucR family transcriptional regulator [Microbacterium trichothecenolyticum]|nr:PucR family transcriptional regulator [Microbacterium trichothecenolyticum]